MNLISLSFVLLCIITLIIYFVIPKKIQWIVLLISSLVFLFYDNFSLGTFLQAGVVLLTTYTMARLIEKNRDSKKAKYFLITGILIVLGVLLYIKYSNMFLSMFNSLFGIVGLNFKFKMINTVSLVGISYYSLIMISYMTDVYRGTCKAQKNILKCALFVYYFPILNSGPFIRYGEPGGVENNLYNGHKFSYEHMCSGLIRIAWGVFKVLVISIRLGYFVDTVFSDLNAYPGIFTIIAVCFFPLQLYTNFSGSIDIIMGVSEIMGIELPENFTSPFFSRTITEFWRNWHITLGSWLKDYVFYPLQLSSGIQKLTKFCKNHFGKKAGKKIPMFLSMFIMWILIGAWHGGAVKFIIGSGVLQFVYILLEDLLTPISEKLNKKLGINTDTFGYRLYQMVRTFLLFSLAMVFFRADSVSNAIEIFKNMFVWNPWVLLDNASLYNAGLDLLDFRILIISLVVLFIVDYLKRKMNVREKLFSQNIVFRWLLIYALLFSIIIFGCYGPGYDAADFIYRGF